MVRTKDAEEPKCFCFPGFTGEKCQYTVECKMKCKNNSTCYTEPGSSQLLCQCQPPFTGPECDQCSGLQCGSSKDSSCAGFKCQHNGTCFLSRTQSGKLQPECRCLDSNFEGRMCEFDKCEAKYCKNGGKGYRLDGVCKCQCREPFTGARCQDQSPDYSCGDLGPCQNGGQCMFGQYCDCSLDYIGPRCNTFVSSESNPCYEVRCLNGGVCTVDTNSMEARCICDSRFRGLRCEAEVYGHCMHGGSPYQDLDGTTRCICPQGFHGFRCELQQELDSGAMEHSIDNTAINSLTITIVAVSIVSVCLVGAVLYLVYFTINRRRLTSPFRHQRMTDGGRFEQSNNMEFANRMFLQDEDEEETRPMGRDEMEPPRNFANPVYETMFQVQHNFSW